MYIYGGIYLQLLELFTAYLLVQVGSFFFKIYMTIYTILHGVVQDEIIRHTSINSTSPIQQIITALSTYFKLSYLRPSINGDGHRDAMSLAFITYYGNEHLWSQNIDRYRQITAYHK